MGVRKLYLVNVTIVPSRPVPFRSAWIEIVKRCAISTVKTKPKRLRLKFVEKEAEIFIGTQTKEPMAAVAGGMVTTIPRNSHISKTVENVSHRKNYNRFNTSRSK